MTSFSLHGGHNSIVQGANWGGRKEHVMNRQVKDAVYNMLKSLGHTVYDDTDEVGTTQAQNLSNIVANCNSHDVELVISLHLNAFDGNAHGVEVLYYDQKDLAAKVSAQLAKDIGWRDRGAKQRRDLAVLKGTKAPAILIELGFIDNDSDMEKWDINKIVNSIVIALTGQSVSSEGTEDGSRKIKTGGLGYDAIKEVSEFLHSVDIKSTIVFEGNGTSPYLLTGKMTNPAMDTLITWLDTKRWYYEYVE